VEEDELLEEDSPDLYGFLSGDDDDEDGNV
jgi:hypothetical protein